jgi:hypothetical protein
MTNLMFLAQAATQAAGGCPKGGCPTWAIAATAGVFVGGALIGYFVGRRAASGKKSQQKRTQRVVSSTPRQPIPAGSVEIYVGNLSYELTEDQLRREFEKFGVVGAARIVADKNGQRSKGFGFVVMPNRSEAEKAIAAMSEKEVMGRKMRVNEARNTIKEDA